MPPSRLVHACTRRTTGVKLRTVILLPYLTLQSNRMLANPCRTREPDVFQLVPAQRPQRVLVPAPREDSFCASVNQESGVSRSLLAILPRCIECVVLPQLVTALIMFAV
jgi:hypothetical protein